MSSDRDRDRDFANFNCDLAKVFGGGLDREGLPEVAKSLFPTAGHFAARVLRSKGPAVPYEGELRVWNNILCQKGMSSLSGTLGGVLVPSTVTAELWRKAGIVDGPFARARRITAPVADIRNATICVPALKESARSEAARHGGLHLSFGLQEDEEVDDRVFASFREVTFRPRRLRAFVVATDDVVQDAPSLINDLDATIAEDLRFSLSHLMIRNGGGGGPLGVLHSPATIKVPRAGAGAIGYADCRALKKRMWTHSRRNAVWCCNAEAADQLEGLTGPQGQTYWQAPRERPDGSMGNPIFMNHPVVLCESASALGDEGDLLFVDWTQYGLAFAGGELPTLMMSAHHFFGLDQHALRWITYVDGSLMWEAPITPEFGSETLSPAVTLTDAAE